MSYHFQSFLVIGWLLTFATCPITPVHADPRRVDTSFFSITVTSPTPFGQPTLFTATANDTTPTNYAWIFGDGTPDADGPQVTHTYTRPGIFTAHVIIYQDTGVAEAVLQVIAIGKNTLYLPVVQR